MKSRKAGLFVGILLFLILIALVAIIGLQLANMSLTGRVVVGSGNVISKTFDVSDFNSIEIRGKGNLYLTQANQYSVMIEAEDNVFDLLNVRVEGDKLIIGENKLFLFKTTEPINIYVVMPELKEISISGSSDVFANNKIKTPELNIAVAGSSDMDIALDVDKLDTSISGYADIVYEGSADEHFIRISGSGDIDALDLFSKQTDISISGSGDIKTYTTDELNVRISGSGDIDYKGNPQITQSVSGFGSVKKID